MHISYNECFEFLNCLLAIGQESLTKKMIKSKPFLQEDPSFHRMLQQIKKQLTKKSYTNINYFFDIHGIGYILYNLIFKYENNHQAPANLPDFMTSLNETTYEETLCYLLTSNFNIDYELLKSTNVILFYKETLATVHLGDKSRQQRLLDYLASPSQLHTLIATVTEFYEQIYTSIEDELKNTCSEYEAIYRQLLKTDPTGFGKRYLGYDNANEVSDSIHISFFVYSGVIQYKNKWLPRDLFVIGMHHHELVEELDPILKLSYFHKILSDPKRLELISYISKRPYFGQELAAKLNIATSTTSYHLNLLMEIGLVSTYRDKKKVYFKFNHENYNELNDTFTQLMLKEPTSL